MVEEEVFRLQVSVDDVQLMYVVNPRDYLLEKFASLFLLQSRVCHDVIKQLSPAGVLHYQVELLGSFNDFVELYDVGMSNQLEYMDFSSHSLDVRHVSYPVLFQDFDCYLY